MFSLIPVLWTLIDFCFSPSFDLTVLTDFLCFVSCAIVSSQRSLYRAIFQVYFYWRRQLSFFSNVFIAMFQRDRSDFQVWSVHYTRVPTVRACRVPELPLEQLQSFTVEFYWVLLGFTGFYWILLGFTGLYWVLLGFTGFYWVLLGITGVLLDFTGYYWVLLGFTGYYWVLLGLTRFYWVLLSFTEFYSLSAELACSAGRFTGFYWVSLGFIGFYWVYIALSGFIDYYQVHLGFTSVLYDVWWLQCSGKFR